SSPQTFYCPAETNPDQMFNQPQNPWPPGEDPGENVEGGYAVRPIVPWSVTAASSNVEAPTAPATMPRVDDLAFDAMLADGAGQPARVDSRHVEGVHALYADAAVRWVDRERIAAPLDAITGNGGQFNNEQDAIWQAYDAAAR